MIKKKIKNAVEILYRIFVKDDLEIEEEIKREEEKIEIEQKKYDKKLKWRG